MTCTTYAKAEDVPPGEPFPTDDTSLEETVAMSSSKKTEPLANKLICMLFAQASDVPPQPPFPPATTTQETTVTPVANVTPDDSEDPVRGRFA